jgi:hypothetical protein
MKYYPKQSEKYNDVPPDNSESAADRYALHLSRLTGFPVTVVLAGLYANAAVREH